MVASFVVDWIASLQVKSVGFALEFFWRREGTGLIIRRIDPSRLRASLYRYHTLVTDFVTKRFDSTISKSWAWFAKVSTSNSDDIQTEDLVRVRYQT